MRQFRSNECMVVCLTLGHMHAINLQGDCAACCEHCVWQNFEACRQQRDVQPGHVLYRLGARTMGCRCKQLQQGRTSLCGAANINEVVHMAAWHSSMLRLASMHQAAFMQHLSHAHQRVEDNCNQQCGGNLAKLIE